MEIKKFKKEETNKKNVIKIVSAFMVIGIMLAGISYAVYQHEEEKLFINAKVGEFKENDIELAIKLDGEQIDTPPAKDNYIVTVECDYADGEWDSEKWGALVTNISANKVKCEVNFKSPGATLSEITATSTNTEISLSYKAEGRGTSTTCKYGTEEGVYPNEVEATNTNCNIKELEKDTTYYYQVCAKNSGGEACKEGSIKVKQRYNIKLANYILEQSKIDSSIEKLEYEATSQTPTLIDYRYVGKNPNNYVYFGCEEDACTENNLYRIIGVIPTQSEVDGKYEERVKLIKNENYNETESGLRKASSLAKGGYGYLWSSQNSNWATSSLNNEVLNKVYWRSLKEYQNYIDNAIWYLGYGTGVDTPLKVYQYERNNKTVPVTNAKNYFITNIGLIYLSDYGLATSGSDRITRTYCLASNSIYSWNGDCINNNWLFDNGYAQHLLFAEGSMNTSDCAGVINPNGQYFAPYCASGGIATHISGVRPAFYLKTNVLCESGEGTLENPYIISINE